MGRQMGIFGHVRAVVLACGMAWKRAARKRGIKETRKQATDRRSKLNLQSISGAIAAWLTIATSEIPPIMLPINVGTRNTSR